MNTPDTRWEIFKIKTLEEFIKQFCIGKNTHKHVPDSIVRELILAEHLQVFSYYSYPIYGDAFSRLTRVFEIAIKYKAEQLEINTKNKSLGKLIQMTTKEYSEYYQNNVFWAKKMRNIFAHPDMNTQWGMIIKLPLIRMTNVINDLFRESEYFKKNYSTLVLLKKKYEYLKNDTWEFNDQIIHSIELLDYRAGFSLWVFHPVLEEYPTDEKLFTIPLQFFIFKDFKILGKNFTGITLNNSKKSLHLTKDKFYIQFKKVYMGKVANTPKGTKQKIASIQENDYIYNEEKFIHSINHLH